jgi:membrane protease subunit HflC
MRNIFTWVIAVIVVLILVIYMFAFQVRYDEVAVRTTFDEATEKSVIATPGLKPRLPWPIQKVTKYSTRIQILDDQLEEQLTADEKGVILRTYVAWRVADPLKFFKNVEDVGKARGRLEPLVRQTRGVISEYSFDQIVNTDPAKLKLGDIEQAMTRRLREQLVSTGYGIEVEKVGIRRVVLPEKTTESVFETMKKTRERMAESTRQEGQAQAAAIRSEAESAAKRMLAFAERYAQSIRAKGDREAAEQYGKFAADQEFANFLFQIRALERMLKNNTTFVLDAQSIDALQWFKKDGTMAPATSPGAERTTQPAASASRP